MALLKTNTIGESMKEVTIEAVKTTRVNDKCRGCMFHHKDHGCIINDEPLRALNLGMCGEDNIIYKIKEK